jgi:hypothetical protein
MSFDADQAPLTEGEHREITRLGESWNAYQADGDAALKGLDPRDAETIRRLRAIAPQPKLRRLFAQRLKESLMESSVPVSLDDVDPAARYAGQSGALSATVAGMAPTLPRRWWGRSVRELGTAAMIAILVVGLAVGYVAFSLPDAEQMPEGVGDILSQATPGSVLDRYPSCNVYGVGCPFVSSLGHGFLNKPDYADADLTAKSVQLFRWTIDPGARIEIPAGPALGAHGAVVDIVVSCTYSITVDAPATISRQQSPLEGDIDYLQSGSVAELSQGDAISYPAGKTRTLTNPLSTVPLTIISVVFFDANAAFSLPADPLPEGVQLTASSSGVLPMTLAEYRSREVMFTLDYVQVQGDMPLPATRYGQIRVIGPVLPFQPEVEEGYVFWVGEPRG